MVEEVAALRFADEVGVKDSPLQTHSSARAWLGLRGAQSPLPTLRQTQGPWETGGRDIITHSGLVLKGCKPDSQKVGF